MPSVRPSVRIAATLLILFLFVGTLEFAARLLSPDRIDDIFAVRPEITERLYTAEERDRTLPIRLPRQGGECMTYRLGEMHWNQWWGFWSKVLDTDCAKKLFEAHPIKVALLGGSAMYNAEATNYRTHIDYLAFGKDERVASINLSESGARLSNMVARLIHEGAALKPDIAVFLDGMNEFTSVLYGGEPGDDFYWTAGVRARVERPMSFLTAKLTEKSALARIVLLQSGLMASGRVQSRAAAPSPGRDVEIYLRDRDIAQTLCRHYNIECVFILQPLAFTTVATNKNAADMATLHDRIFPNDRQMFTSAYELLRKNGCDNCIDASRLFDGVDDAFYDVVHFTKNGGTKLGALIHEQVLAAYARKQARAKN